jgi:hypothetical protein
MKYVRRAYLQTLLITLKLWLKLNEKYVLFYKIHSLKMMEIRLSCVLKGKTGLNAEAVLFGSLIFKQRGYR